MTEDSLKLLNYNKLWLDNGVLTLETLQAQLTEFKLGEDTNTEHYRYRTFKEYLKTSCSLTRDNIAMLFEIIKTEPDTSAAISMGLDILKIRNFG